jgi:cytoskeletal protein CcmA (bactofilin family)
MGFFKDFKEDITQAVNELLPNEDGNREDADNQIVNTLDMEDRKPDEASNSEMMKEWLEKFTQEEQASSTIEEGTEESLPQGIENELDDTNNTNSKGEEDEGMEDNVDLELLQAMEAEEAEEKEIAEKETNEPKLRAASISEDDGVTIITKGTTINGNITSDCSLEIYGTITGDIDCLSKVSIAGKVKGNISAAEVYVNTERMEGCITSEGSIKVGLGTVIIGDVVATSGVIAGAIKGEIDINGPIVIDSTAIIKGNIKAKSVQINNGAVVEGFCSLCYSEVNLDNIFD